MYQDGGYSGYSYDFYESEHAPQRGVGGGLSWKDVFLVGTLEGEPSLSEELGINFEHMKHKMIRAINPYKSIDQHIMDDTDLAGPLFMCLLLGSFLLARGKVHFGYIYGVGTLGCILVYFILNLMSENGIDIYKTISVLGYSLIPIVLLSFLSIFFSLKEHYVGVPLGVFAVMWCTYSSSRMFVSVLNMRDQAILIAYPIGLLYSCFTLMTLF